MGEGEGERETTGLGHFFKAPDGRTEMDCTRKLAEFCAGVRLEKLPEPVIRKAKLCILDYIANVYGSLELNTVSAIASYIRSLGGEGRATALGLGFRTGIHHAAFINGVAGEAIEAQDGLRFGGNHPGTAVIPAALALAEDLGCRGREVIEAVVAGYEAANRTAAAMHPKHTLSGFLPTGTCGTFGAAAAAGRLLGFDADRMMNGLGNAGYLLPLSMAQTLMGGFTVKTVQGGQAASCGLMAAGLAQAGVTGDPMVLEGSVLKGGFLQITTQMEPNGAKLLQGLGEHYTIMDVYFKPYTACRHTHGAAQATLEIVREARFDPKDVRKVDVFTYAIAALAVGKIFSEKDSFVSAQFSIPYVVAACVLAGDMGPRQLRKTCMTDPRLLAMVGKVAVQQDEELNKAYPDKTATRVEILLADGTRHSRQVDIPKGDPRTPLEEEALGEKVLRFAGERDAGRVKEMTARVLDLENVKQINELTRAV
jgi:2-methylcitrate dehydratase PrpD